MPEEVVSDTSPIQYLHQAGCLDLLAALYGSIVIPEAVAEELAEGIKLGVSLPDLESIPWIQTQAAPHQVILPMVVDLGPGESEVLAMTADRPGTLALLDDGLARHFARRLEIRCTGTLGILLKAKQEGHLKTVSPTIQRLEELGFRLDSTTKATVLRLADET